MSRERNYAEKQKLNRYLAFASARAATYDASTAKGQDARAPFVPRLLDILFSIIGLTVLFPLMCVIFAAIKLEGGGSALALQKIRSLRGGRTQILKFRTRQAKSPNEFTKVGWFLCATGLDRLPYVFAVLKGDIALFGRTSLMTVPRMARPISNQEVSYNVYAEVLKRPLDIFLVLLAAPAILIVVGVLYVLVRRDGGSGFFGQLRVGKHGEEFRCWKIRTMQPNAQEMLKAYLKANPEAAKEWEENRKLADDPRITPLGKLLRKTSLDEFPQFWNVIKGDMSLVGPRPVPRDELNKYGGYASYYKAVKPGVTGLWQVSGRNDISYGERIQLDVTYAKTVNLVQDIAIVLKTATAMLNRTGN